MARYRPVARMLIDALSATEACVCSLFVYSTGASLCNGRVLNYRVTAQCRDLDVRKASLDRRYSAAGGSRPGGS